MGFTVCSVAQASAQVFETILEQEAIHQQQLAEKLRKPMPPSEMYVPKVLFDKKLTVPKSNQFTFRRIKLQGVTKLSKFQQQKLLKPYLDVPLTTQEINDLLKKITDVYIGSGFVAARAYLAPQNLSSGTLSILIIEGHVSDYSIQENGNIRKSLHNVLPRLTGNVVNLRDLEQAVDQITRLPGYSAQIDLIPGKASGDTIVRINTNMAKKWMFTTALDNYGTKSVGDHQIEYSANVNDILHLYESFTLNYKQAAFADPSKKYMKSLTFQSSMPYQYWTLRYLGSQFKYLTTVVGQNQSFQYSGKGMQNRLEIERIMSRNYTGKTGFALAVATRDNQNYIEDIQLNSSSNKISIVELRLFHVRRMLNGITHVSVSYNRGLKIFGALNDKQTPMDFPKAQFNKWRFDLSFMRPFEFYKQRFSWELQTSYQYSPQTLYSDDRFTIGGRHTISGFKNNSLSGDVGWYLRNALHWSHHTSKTKSILGGFSSFIGYDVGEITRGKGVSSNHGYLSGAVIGLKMQGGALSGEFAISKALAKPKNLDYEGTLWLFKMGLNF